MRVEVPPVALDEAAAIVINLVITQVAMLAAGLAGAVVRAGVASGDWEAAVLGFGWVDGVAASLGALPAAPTALAAACLGAVLCVAAYFWEKRAFAKRDRADVLRLRRGVDGELPRLPVVVWLALMVLAGFAEELLFRYALCGLALDLIAGSLPCFAATAAAVIISSVVFWLAHARYRSLASTTATLLLGVALGAAFIATESLAVAAGTHALYNIGVLAIARFRMHRDPEYFGGPAPTRALLDQLEGEGARPESDA